MTAWAKTDDDYGTGQECTGGGVVFAKDGSGRFGALIRIGQCPELMRERSIETQYAAHHVPVLCHELGHVDDFEKRINLRPTKLLDIAAIELYAHRYACKMMVRHNLRMCLQSYLDILVPNLVNDGAEAVMKAASLFLASDDCKEFNRFLRKQSVS